MPSELAQAQACLWGAGGERARVYLDKLGLDPHVWQRYGLGYAPGRYDGSGHHPAIAMPWAAERRQYLRHLFIDGPNMGRIASDLRYPASKVVFGIQHLPADRAGRVLLMVVGEMRALACYQVLMGMAIDVVAVLPSITRLPAAAIAAAAGYDGVFVWMNGGRELCRAAGLRAAPGENEAIGYLRSELQQVT